MPSQMLLDTNAYALFFQNPRASFYEKFTDSLKEGGTVSFYIPEIVSMEIHSVLGTYRRGGNPVSETLCDRDVRVAASVIKCQHLCVYPARRKMGLAMYKSLLKLIDDIEHQRGDIQATILPLAQKQMMSAQNLLRDYSDRYSFGSHDALVAGCLLTAISEGMSLTMVTSDRGLKALCREKQLPLLDPYSLGAQLAQQR